MQSLKDNGWKIAFWNGPFSGDMFIFDKLMQKYMYILQIVLLRKEVIKHQLYHF